MSTIPLYIPISFKCINRSDIIASNGTSFKSPVYLAYVYDLESEAVKTVAGLMVLSARTAPNVVGMDSIKVEVTTDEDQDKLATEMIKQGKDLKIDFFRINGDEV